MLLVVNADKQTYPEDSAAAAVVVVGESTITDADDPASTNIGQCLSY